MPQFISPGLMVGAGIGNALSQGVDTFLKAKQMNQQNNFEKTKLGLMGAKEGYDVDSDTGLLKPNDYGQAIQTAKIAGAQLQGAQSKRGLQDITDEDDPTSDRSLAAQSVGQYAASVAGESPYFQKNPDKLKTFQNILSNGSHRQVTEALALAKPIMSDQVGEDKYNMMLSKLTNTTNNKDKTDQTATFGAIQKATAQPEKELNAAKKLSDLTDDAVKTPVSANALSIYAARYSTGDKRINETEIKNMGQGSKAIMANLSQIAQTAEGGTLTPENAAFMKKFINVTNQSNMDEKGQIEDKYIGQYARKNGLDPDDASQQILGYPTYATRTKKPNGLLGNSNSQASPQFSEGQTATNPQTGEKIIFKGGQWVPAR